MARDKEKNIDMTFLSVEQANKRGFIHRDYIAHVMRWTHVMKYLRPNTPSKILEAGCGVLAPLAKTMYTSRHTMHKYLGVDYGPIKPEINFGKKFTPSFLERTDFSDVTRQDIKLHLGGPADVVVSFEVLEHVLPDHAARMVKQMMHLSSKDVVFFISTPVYDEHVGAANNHINEWTYNGLRGMFEALGLVVENHWGTFASQTDYKKDLSDELRKVYDSLAEYYDTNMLACIMAPLIPPHQARNVLWRLRKGGSKSTEFSNKIANFTKFSELGQCTDKEAWARFFNEINITIPF